MNIDKAIRIFAIFLNNSIENVSQLLDVRDYNSKENSMNDWLQANWEFLVERKVLKPSEYLEVYGEGADYYGSSSRISDPSALPNYSISIKSRDENIFDILNEESFCLKNVTFEKLVGFIDGYYHLKPDFKYALINDDEINKQRVVLLKDIEFQLKLVH